MSNFYKKNNNQKHQGFTLIEMSVVLLIIAALSAIVLSGVGGQTVQARDTRRIADLRNVANYLTQYLGKYGSYPTATNWDNLERILRNSGVVSVLPKDPSTGFYTYWYCWDITSSDSPTHFILRTRLEQTKNAAPKLYESGMGTDTIPSWASNCMGTSSFATSQCDQNQNFYCIGN